MATEEGPPEAGTTSLVEVLAQVLPQDIKFTAHHLSTPPTITEPLYYPPAYPSTSAGESRARKPLKTYCEKQFLAISIDAPESKEQVLALALEIYIYTTAHSSILFVAKADSTGYLGLLKLPKGTPSPIREIATAFISYLITNRKRQGIQSVVNLFARSQSQYLFPGSVKNSGKHILDDRGLVKWWCRVLDPFLDHRQVGQVDQKIWINAHGYLIIPGLDDYETRAFLPRTATASKHWTLGHPLERISPYIADPVTYGSTVPIRCLIPTYPDDPKARYVQELEEATSTKLKLTGGWRSPRTLDQFWEMMSFRQECSSGRMTGFIWLVFNPPSSTQRSVTTTETASSDVVFKDSSGASSSTPSDFGSAPRLPTPEPSQGAFESTANSSSSPMTAAKIRGRQLNKKKTAKLKGRIISRHPKVKTQQRAHFPKETKTAYYCWPDAGRGQVVLDESGYNRAVELLLHLEFSTLEQATTSSARWTKDVNFGKDWGLKILGRLELPTQEVVVNSEGVVTHLTAMIKKKRPATDVASDTPDTSGSNSSGANVLGGSLVRKKAKTTSDTLAPPVSTEVPSVHTLGASLIRRKPKPA